MHPKKYVNMNDIDCVIFTGDLSDKHNDFSKLLGIFKEKKIFMVPGNHETRKKIDVLTQTYNVHLVGNSPILLHDNLALFGSNYIGIGPFGMHEQDIFENIVTNFKSIEDVKCKIHLNHMPPARTKMGDASPFFPMIGGSEAVRTFLDNFSCDLTLCGHIHETSGLEEIVGGNLVRNMAQRFDVLEFNTLTSKLSVLK